MAKMTFFSVKTVSFVKLHIKYIHVPYQCALHLLSYALHAFLPVSLNHLNKMDLFKFELKLKIEANNVNEASIHNIVPGVCKIAGGCS